MPGLERATVQITAWACGRRASGRVIPLADGDSYAG